jgi:hypothetical protein
MQMSLLVRFMRGHAPLAALSELAEHTGTGTVSLSHPLRRAMVSHVLSGLAQTQREAATLRSDGRRSIAFFSDVISDIRTGDSATRNRPDSEDLSTNCPEIS